MAQPYVGEIKLFAGNFAINGWAFCDGSLIPISENETLFVLIGTTYGGDGESTFALPDLRGRVPIHQGQGPGLSQYTLGEMAGVEEVTLTNQQIPNHNHPFVASTSGGQTRNPAANLIASPPALAPYVRQPPDTSLSAQAVAFAGGSQPHTNFMPSMGTNYIISLFGIFPRFS